MLHLHSKKLSLQILLAVIDPEKKLRIPTINNIIPIYLTLLGVQPNDAACILWAGLLSSFYITQTLPLLPNARVNISFDVDNASLSSETQRTTMFASRSFRSKASRNCCCLTNISSCLSTGASDWAYFCWWGCQGIQLQSQVLASPSSLLLVFVSLAWTHRSLE